MSTPRLGLEEVLGDVSSSIESKHSSGSRSRALAPTGGLLVGVGAAAGPGGRERERADPLGGGQRDVLGDRPAHRDAEQVEALEAELVGEPERVGGHVGVS